MKRKQAPQRLTLEQLVTRYLSASEADREQMGDMAAHVLTQRRAGGLTPEDTAWVDRQTILGLRMGLAARLDREQVQVGPMGWSTRKFLAQLDETGKHSWSTIEQVLAAAPTAPLRVDSIRHCWSVVNEHVAGLVAQKKLLVLLGEDDGCVRQEMLKQFLAADLGPVA
jgi:hypothetical protein